MDVLKSTSSSYVKNTIENMILTSYTNSRTMPQAEVGKSQAFKRDKLEYQISQQFLSRDKLILSRDISFMSHQRSHYSITIKHLDTAKDAFSI